MEIYNINVAESAEIDLHDIIKYISEQFMADVTARQLLNEIENKISSLATFPERIPLISDDRLHGLGYRKLSVKNYLIFFSINKRDRMVNIERILYKRRNWMDIIK